MKKSIKCVNRKSNRKNKPSENRKNTKLDYFKIRDKYNYNHNKSIK